MKTVRGVDQFCGAGGTSTGLVRACERLGRSVDLLAINHWPEAIATHTLNHAGVRHLCEDLGAIDPRTAVPDGKLDILLASPERAMDRGRPDGPHGRVEVLTRLGGYR